MSNPFLLFGVSVTAEIIAVAMMEVYATSSNVFHALLAGGAAFFAYGSFFAIQVQKVIDLQFLYPIWSGATTALSYLVGGMIHGKSLQELLTAPSAIWVLVTIIGIVGTLATSGSAK